MTKQRLLVAIFLALSAAGAFLRISITTALDPRARLEEYRRVDYYEFGRGLREFGVLGWNGSPDAFRGVAYPAFLALIEDYGPGGTPRILAANALLSAAAVPAAGWAALQLGGPVAALAATTLVAFHPALLESLGGCRIEIFYSGLIILVALALIAWTRAPTPVNTWILGFAIAVSLLCRGVLFLLPPVLVAVYWTRDGFAPTRRRWSWMLLASSYVFLLPWVARNAVQLGTFTPFEDHAATRNFFAASMGIVENTGIGPYQDVLANEVDPHGALREDPLARLHELAVESIRQAPGAYLASCLRRAFFAFRNFWAVFLAALAGFLLRRKDPAVAGLAALSAYFVSVHIPMSLELRYFEPGMPGLLILAGVACADAWRRIQGAAAPSRPAAALRIRPALILPPLVGIYLLGSMTLAREVALTKFPCSLAESGLSLYRCGQHQAAAGAPREAERSWNRSLALLDADPAAPPRLKAKVAVELAGGIGGLAKVAVSSPEELWEKAIWLQNRRRFSEAIALFDILVAGQPRRGRYLADRGLARVLAGESAEGLKDFIRAETMEPEDLQAWLNHGALLERDGRPTEALRVYSRALEAAKAPLRPGQMPPLYLPVIAARRQDLSERAAMKRRP